MIKIKIIISLVLILIGLITIFNIFSAFRTNPDEVLATIGLGILIFCIFSLERFGKLERIKDIKLIGAKHNKMLALFFLYGIVLGLNYRMENPSDDRITCLLTFLPVTSVLIFYTLRAYSRYRMIIGQRKNI